MRKLFALTMLLFITSAASAENLTTTHALSLRGAPKYKEGFKNFAYVNPNAPKGGTITLATIGTYDNFHRYAQRGVSASGSEEIYDSLMVSSDDEIGVFYPLIAENAQYPEDFSWVTFQLNPKARFQDGRPITSEDVIFSFYKFFDEGVPQFKQYYKDITDVKAEGKYKVTFTANKPSKEMLTSLAGGLKILPKHFWKKRNFAEPLTEVPVGSSVYKIKDYKIGQYIVYERDKNYWAKDLPSKKGQQNFDIMKYDYYRDQTVALEAFKAGEYDFRQENVSKYWTNLYKGPNFDKNFIVKEEISHEIPQGMQAFVFNIQRPFFKDPKVREALNYAMDFEWINKNLFYDQYTRTRSYFQNTEYEARGLPGEDELAILNPLKGQISDRVFTEEFQPSKTNGSGNIRNQIRVALRILKSAGWVVKDRVLTNVKTGEPMEFELLLYSQTMERVAIPLQNNLKRLGVTMNIRMVDTTQFINRLRSRDFDIIARGFSANNYPSTDLKIIWRSDYMDYSYNTPGVQDPAVDAIIDGIGKNQQNEKALLAHGRALDRVLQWNFYVIPQWHINRFRFAHWNKFDRPEIRPKYDLGRNTWWVDQEKADKLPERSAVN